MKTRLFTRRRSLGLGLGFRRCLVRAPVPRCRLQLLIGAATPQARHRTTPPLLQHDSTKTRHSVCENQQKSKRANKQSKSRERTSSSVGAGLFRQRRRRVAACVPSRTRTRTRTGATLALALVCICRTHASLCRQSLARAEERFSLLRPQGTHLAIERLTNTCTHSISALEQSTNKRTQKHATNRPGNSVVSSSFCCCCFSCNPEPLPSSRSLALRRFHSRHATTAVHRQHSTSMVMIRAE